MNKKLITLCLAAALTVAPMAAFAEAIDAQDKENTTPVTDRLPGQTDEVVREEREVRFVSFDLTVDSIEKNEGTYTLITKDENGEETHVTVSEDFKVIYNNEGKQLKAAELKKDDKITIYVAANKPMLMIYPPQYTPDALIVQDEKIESKATVDKFVKNGDQEDSFINEFDTLVLNVGEGEEGPVIVDVDGNKVERADLDGRDLCVFYTITTFSIPPQTPPEKIVVLPKVEADELAEPTASPEPEQIPAATLEPAMPIEVTEDLVVNGTDIHVDVQNINGHQILPVRAIAEAMGLEVEWDNDLRAVTVGTVPMGVNFRIDVDSYNKSRMTPFTFGQAPVLVGDKTYVPVEFFTEILEAEVTIDGAKTIINREVNDN